MFDGLQRRRVALLGAGLLLVALTGCSTGTPQAVARTSPGPTPVPSSSSAAYTPAPSTPDTPPTTVAPVKVDCTAPTVKVTKFEFTKETPVADLARDMVFNAYSPREIVVQYTNRSTNQIEVSYVTGRVAWKNVPNPDRAEDYVSPMDMELEAAPGKKTEHMNPGETRQTGMVWPSAGNIPVGSGTMTASAFAHWTFVSPAVEATCHLIPARTLRVGTPLKEGAPFTVTRTRTVPGAVLADVKFCASIAATSGSNGVLDASAMWAVTATGVKVMVSGSENPKAKTAGAGRLTVPVKSLTCRTTTVAFLTRAEVTYVAAPGDQGVPWRWKL